MPDVRTERLELRLTAPEKALVDQEAKAAGLTASELVRQRMFEKVELGGDGESVSQRPAKASAVKRSAGSSPAPSADAFNKRVAELARTLPRSTARRIAHQELG